MSAASSAIKVIRKIVSNKPRKTILESRAAIAHSIDNQIAKTRKVSNADAAKIARETVGKAPYGRARSVVSNKTELTEREGTTGFKAAERAGKRIERVRKLTGPVVRRRVPGKTAGDIAKEKQAANAARRDKFNKDMKPKKRVVKKAEPRKVVKTKAGGTVSNAKGKVDADKFAKIKAEDIKNVVQRRMAKSKLDPKEKVTVTRPDGSTVQMTRAERDSLNTKLRNAGRNPKNSFAKSREEDEAKKYSDRELRDIAADDRAKDLSGAMNRQYAQSGTTWRNPATGKLERTQTKVADPMFEEKRLQESREAVDEGFKQQRLIKRGRGKPNLKLTPEAKKKFAVKKTANYKIKKGK